MERYNRMSARYSLYCISNNGELITVFRISTRMVRKNFIMNFFFKLNIEQSRIFVLTVKSNKIFVKRLTMSKELN